MLSTVHWLLHGLHQRHGLKKVKREESFEGTEIMGTNTFEHIWGTRHFKYINLFNLHKSYVVRIITPSLWMKSWFWKSLRKLAESHNHLRSKARIWPHYPLIPKPMIYLRAPRTFWVHSVPATAQTPDFWDSQIGSPNFPMDQITSFSGPSQSWEHSVSVLWMGQPLVTFQSLAFNACALSEPWGWFFPRGAPFHETKMLNFPRWFW